MIRPFPGIIRGEATGWCEQRRRLYHNREGPSIMADNNLAQRLERIEAALPALAGKADIDKLRVDLPGMIHDGIVRELERVATNIDDLRNELRTNNDALRVEMRGLRGEMAGLAGLIRPLTEALARWPDLFAALTDRVRRLEEGGRS